MVGASEPQWVSEPVGLSDPWERRKVLPRVLDQRLAARAINSYSLRRKMYDFVLVFPNLC